MGFYTRTKLVYFDKNVIRRNWSRMNRGPIQKAGNLVRLFARQSIKRRGPRTPPSSPGTPPHSRRPGRTPPMKMIYSVPQHFGTSAIIGFVGFGNSNPVPGLHEHGGWARRMVFVKGRRPLKKGGFGGIQYKRMMKGVRYRRRPTMVPALTKAVPVLPFMWRDSLHRPI